MDYYIVKFIYLNKTYLCIWFTGDEDGFIADKGMLMLFSNEEEIVKYALAKSCTLNEQVTFVSVDKVIEWLMQADKFVDSKLLLEFWNIITDLSKSINENFYGNSNDDVINSLYGKLFYSNNLPAFKGDEEEFVAKWNQVEIGNLSKLVEDGIKILISQLERQKWHE